MAEMRGETLKLWFVGQNELELYRTHFVHPLIASPLQAVRGNDARAFPNSTSFKWTSAVKALALFILRASVTRSDKLGAFSENEPVLSGMRRSAAASLDYALSRDSNWLTEMFGIDTRGNSLARRLIKRSNPELKREGPVALSLNHSVLSPCSIEIFLNDELVRDNATLLFIAERIEDHWKLPDESQASDSHIPLNVKYPVDNSAEFVDWVSSQIQWWDSRFVLPKIPAVTNQLTELYVEPEFIVPHGAPLSTDRLLEEFFSDQKNRALILTGEMGTGKSFFLRHLTLELNRYRERLGIEIPYVPILVSLGRFEMLQGSLTRSLVEYYMSHGYEGSASTLQQFLKRCLDAGQALLLLDGLDEIGHINHRTETLALIQQHFENSVQARGNKLIITGNSEVFSQRDISCKDFRTVQIGRWHSYQVFLGCQRWPWEQKYDGELFWRLLQANDALFSLAQWPLVFHLLTTLFSTLGVRAFQDLAGICDSCCEVLEDSWSYARRTFRKRVGAEQSSREALEPFAWLRWRHFLIFLMENALKKPTVEGGELPLSFSSDEIVATWNQLLQKRGLDRTSFDFNRLKDLIQYQKTIGPVFYQSKARVGTEENAAAEEEYLFLDDIFAYFYLAKALINQPAALEKQILRYFRDPRWSRVISLALQELGRSDRTYESDMVDTLLAKIDCIDDEFKLDHKHGIGNFRIFTRMRSLGSINLDSYWDEVVEPWMHIYFTSDYAYDVATAFQILGEYSASPRIRNYLFDRFDQMMTKNREKGSTEKWRVFAAMAKIGEKADHIVAEFEQDINQIIDTEALATPEQSVALRRFIWCLRQVGRLFKRDHSSQTFRPNLENINRIRNASMKLVEFIACDLERQLKSSSFEGCHMWDCMTALVQTQHKLQYYSNLSETILRFGRLACKYSAAFNQYPFRRQAMIFLRVGFCHANILSNEECLSLRHGFDKLRSGITSTFERNEVDMILASIDNRSDGANQESEARKLFIAGNGSVSAETLNSWGDTIREHCFDKAEDPLQLGFAVGSICLFYKELAGEAKTNLRNDLVSMLLQCLENELLLDYDQRERDRYYAIPFTDQGYPLYDHIQTALVRLASVLPLSVEGVRQDVFSAANST